MTLSFGKIYFIIELTDSHIEDWKEQIAYKKAFKKSELFDKCGQNKKYKLERNAIKRCAELNASQSEFKLQVIKTSAMYF